MITYSINPGAHLVTCHVSGSLRALDVGNFIEALWDDSQFKEEYDTLIFVDGATVAPDLIARNALAELLLAWRKLQVPAKWAFIVPSSAWQRIANQLVEQYDLSRRNVRCFAETGAAMPWLAREPSAL